MTRQEETQAFAVFVSPKADFRSAGEQLENKGIYIEDEQKTSKRFLGSLRGLIRSSFGNPTFSFYAPDG
jgi:hypothetical protein